MMPSRVMPQRIQYCWQTTWDPAKQNPDKRTKKRSRGEHPEAASLKEKGEEKTTFSSIFYMYIYDTFILYVLYVCFALWELKRTKSPVQILLNALKWDFGTNKYIFRTLGIKANEIPCTNPSSRLELVAYLSKNEILGPTNVFFALWELKRTKSPVQILHHA